MGMPHPHEAIYDQGFTDGYACGLEAAWDPDTLNLWPDVKRTAREIIAKKGGKWAVQFARASQALLAAEEVPPPGTQLPMF
jgi:hypothetical protein